MIGFAVVDISKFDGHTASNRILLSRLIELSGAPGGTADQESQFFDSFSAQAYVDLVRKAARGPL